MTASVTIGRALRYAKGSARGLLHHHTGHCLQFHAFAGALLLGDHVISAHGNASENGMARYFRRKAEGLYDMDDLSMRTEQMAAFLNSAKALIGADRVIGLGYSNGANILAAIAFRNPKIVDDLVLIIRLSPLARPRLTSRDEGC